jgi:hypothetical protein
MDLAIYAVCPHTVTTKGCHQVIYSVYIPVSMFESGLTAYMGKMDMSNGSTSEVFVTTVPPALKPLFLKCLKYNV